MNISIFVLSRCDSVVWEQVCTFQCTPPYYPKTLKRETNETESKAGLEKCPVRLSNISRHLADQVSKQWSLASKL